MRHAALLATALTVLAPACRASEAGEPTTAAAGTAVVVRGELSDRVVLTGELRPSTEGSVSIHSPTVNDELTIRFLAEDGARVKTGDRVVEFDTTNFTQGLEDKRIAARDAVLTAADADALAIIADADKEVTVRQAEITLEKAKLNAAIPADLLSPHDAQKNDLDKTEAEIALVKAKRDLASVRESDALDHHVRILTRDKVKLALDEAQESIKALTIAAPVDGVFVVGDHPWQGRKIQVGDNAWAGMTLARIPDANHALEVFADLSDVDDGRVSTGMTGTCTLDAYPTDPVPCTVSELTPVARDKSKTSLRRAFAITLSLATSDATRQRPGMSVKIVLARAPQKDALLVPRGAILFDEDGKTTRAKLATGELRDVTLGACDAQVCAIANGLAEGEKVQL